METSLESINHFSPLKSTANFAAKPMEAAKELKENDSLLSEIGSRALLLVQTVTSLLALPIILLFGLLEAAFHTITCNGSKAGTTLKATLEAVTIHLLLLAPASLVAALTPDCVREPTGKALLKVTEKVLELWQFNCCKSTHSQTDYDRDWNASQAQHTR